MLAVVQPDLLAPSPRPPEPEPDPLAELRAILEHARRLDRLPFERLPAAMEKELRIVGLGRRAGREGEALASAILDEFERLHAVRDRALAQVRWTGKGAFPLPAAPIPCDTAADRL